MLCQQPFFTERGKVEKYKRAVLIDTALISDAMRRAGVE